MKSEWCEEDSRRTLQVVGTILETGEVPSRDSIDAACRALNGGFVVGVPSDTVYGLVADVSYTGAADRLFAMKQRSRIFELAVLVADVDQAMSLTMGVPDTARVLMEKFWPGAITLVLPRHPDFVADLGSDDETVGVRCPAHIVPRLLCEEVGPLATASAGLEGHPPLTTAQEVAITFGESIALVLDGGVCSGKSSTVVDVTGTDPKLLRAGRICWEDILAVLS